MKKIKKKTHKATSKRFKLTRKGKLIHGVQGGNHLRMKKSRTQKARTKGNKTLEGAQEQIKRIKELL